VRIFLTEPGSNLNVPVRAAGRARRVHTGAPRTRPVRASGRFHPLLARVARPDRPTRSDMPAAIEAWPGEPYPLGATYDGAGTNFSLFSEVAE